MSTKAKEYEVESAYYSEVVIGESTDGYTERVTHIESRWVDGWRWETVVRPMVAGFSPEGLAGIVEAVKAHRERLPE